MKNTNTILRENMIRFGTKNLTENMLNLTKLTNHKDLLDQLSQPGQSDSVYQTKIDELIQALGGTTAALQVAKGSIDYMNKMADRVERGWKDKGYATMDQALIKKLIRMTPFKPADQAKLITDILALADKIKTPPQAVGSREHDNWMNLFR